MKMRFAYDGSAAFSAPRSSGSRIGALLGDAIAMPRQWLRRSHERRALSQLDDHMLRDIGLDRFKAREMATRPFWRA